MAPALPYIAAGTGLLGTLGSLFGGGQGKPVESQLYGPQGLEPLQNQAAQMIQQRMGQPSPYAQMNPMMLNAMNMMSKHYTGQPYTHPGMGMSQGGMPMQGGQQGQMGQMPGQFPPGLSQMPRQMSNFGGMPPMQGPMSGMGQMPPMQQPMPGIQTGSGFIQDPGARQFQR